VTQRWPLRGQNRKGSGGHQLPPGNIGVYGRKRRSQKMVDEPHGMKKYKKRHFVGEKGRIKAQMNEGKKNKKGLKKGVVLYQI